MNNKDLTTNDGYSEKTDGPLNSFYASILGRYYKNGGQFDRKFNLPEDSFKQGGNHLHDSIYSSSLEQYPGIYAKGGTMNFKSNAAYKAWLGYGHASGAFEKTPGNQPVSIGGKSHNVQHAMGGLLGNPYVNVYDNGGDMAVNTPTPKTLSSMTVPERTALIYQAVTQYVNQAKADGRLAPNENLNVEGIVGQILLETANGTSSLVKRANNFGGIKADANWTGPKSGAYRAYATPEEGLKAQVDFYLDNPRYRKNGVFNATTPQEHFEAVQRAGYAEAKNYVEAGMGMVKSIKPRLAKVDMTKLAPAETFTSEVPPISEEEIKQGIEPINRLGIKPLQPLNVSPYINTAPEVVPYTTTASAKNQMPNLSSEAPSIPKGWFGGNNGLFGGNRQKKFAEGGLMNQLTEFNEGGSHEENPLGGIPQGMNQNGGVNLVQEGETKNNAQNFIYSDDITISKSIAKQFNINSRFVGKTYADASKKANKTDSRRETDTIEQNAIAKDLDKLAQAQETQKQEELQKDIAKMTEKHPEFMAQMMQQQSQPPMEQPSPEEMAMMQQQQGQEMDPAMLQQMQPGMTYGGPMSYKCGGNMYDFGGFMQENNDAFTQAGTGALKGAGKGAMIGANPLLMAATGGLSAPIGAVVGGISGGIFGGIKGHKQDEAEYQAKIDAANRERLTGIQTDIPQEASNNSAMALGQAALQGGQDMMGVFMPTAEQKRNGGPMGYPLTNLYALGGPMPPDNAPAGTPYVRADRNSWMGDYANYIPMGQDLSLPLDALDAYKDAFKDGLLEPAFKTIGEYVDARENWERNRKIDELPPSATRFVTKPAKAATTTTVTPPTPLEKAYFIKGPNNENQWVDENTYYRNKGPKTEMPLDANGYPVMPGTGGQRYTEYDKSPSGIPAYNPSGRLTYGGNMYNKRFDIGGGIGENNEGAVLVPDGTILTGTGDLYNWNIANNPTLENLQTSSNSGPQQETITKKEEKKNQFSDYKTEQDAMKDKFSMNETLGQFVGSNLGAGYNLYQGLFGKKAKVPSSKDMFTPVSPYRMNINPQLRAAEETYAGAAKGLMNVAPSGGAYLTNRAMLAASEAATRAGIMAQAENAYGASKLQTDMFNSQGKSQAKLKEFELKSAIDAAKQNYLQAGLQGISEATNAQKANQAALIYANMHGGGEYTAEASPYLQQLAMEYQKRKEAKKATRK